MWDVRPEDALQRTSCDRRSSERAGDADDNTTPERSAVEDGWLCFQAGPVRRRFAPIPPAWSELPDGVLRLMVDIASSVTGAAPIPNRAVPESR